MASLDEKKILEEIQKKQFRCLYYCYGEEPFKLNNFLETLQNALFHGAANTFNTEVYYGDELEAARLLEAVDSFSLWGGKKLVIVKNADRIPAKQQELLRDLPLREGGENILVFLATKADMRTKWIQAISKSPRAALSRFENAEAWELLQWARRFAKAEGKELDESAAQLLAEWMQGSLSDLKHAVEKAALFAAGQSQITEESVRAVSIRMSPESVFEFSGALLRRNRALALAKLHELLEQGEEPLALLGLVARQYRWLLAILALKAEGKGDAEIQSQLRIFPKAAKELFSAAGKLGAKGVMRGLNQLTEADIRLKSSPEPHELVLTRLTLDLVQYL